MSTRIDQNRLSEVRKSLSSAHESLFRHYPGESTSRQPVHTVYGGAQLFKSDTATKMGGLALRSLKAYGPDADTLANCLGIEDKALAATVYQRVVDKLEREPVEDFRIDFEDGYGNRPDDEEDADAVRTAEEVAKGMDAGTLPPFIGIRIKSFSEELFPRSARTLDLFVSTLLAKTGGKLPGGFVVTLPKVMVEEEVKALSALLSDLEKAHAIADGTLKLELMIETPQAIFDASGKVALPALVDAAGGRCVGAHFGTYDYTALVNVTAAWQSMVHPACDFAHHVMQVSLAGRGLMLSDGATVVMPVGPHKAPKGGSLTPEQEAENRAVVHRAWKMAYDHNRHSLIHAFYQGWDLHPGQLPIRYAAVYTFFLEGLDAASARLKAFVEKAAQATLLGDVFDDAATGQGLLNFFLRGISCGAITEEEAKATGLSLEEIRGRSFLKILDARKAR